VRILILSNVQWPRFGIFAGGTAHALEVAKILALTHSVRVMIPSYIAGDARRNYPELDFLETPVPKILARSTVATQLLSMLNWAVFRREIAEADAIVAGSHFLGDVLPLFVSRRPAEVVIVHHVVEPPWRRSGNFVTNTLHFFGERAGLVATGSRADAVITDSQIVAAQLRDAGIRQRLFLTVNAPPGPVPAGSPHERKKNALFLGRLSPTKGVEPLLQAWKIVSQTVPDALLFVAGGGDPKYVRMLTETAHRLGIERSVRFLGRVDEETKWRLLGEASVFAFPSVEEGFGIAVAEALLAGLPCVTYDLPIFDELFPAGRLTAKRDDVAALARSIVALLDDRVLRDELGEAGRSYCARYSWESAARLDLDAVEFALNKRRKDER